MSTRMFALLFVPITSLGLIAGDVKPPLPEAPIRVVIPDVPAFDAALKGAYRRALTGNPKPNDPVASAWRKTQVGSKLEDQWMKFSKDLPLTWDEILKFHPKSLGLALLEVGHLEAVLVMETPLAALATALPAGTHKSHGGVSYDLVAAGAADGSDDPDRRMGLAWARMGERLILATSERALKLAIDEAQAGRGFTAPLPGIVSMELDLEVLRKDRYFKREFLFPEGPETGKIRAALRLDGGHLVEVREGVNDPRGSVFTFEAPAAAAQGWEPEGQEFWPAFRRGLLEPIPNPADKPVPALVPLPSAARQATEDRYAINLTQPMLVAGASPWEEGDLKPWKALLDKKPILSWGYWITQDGARRLAFAWPEAMDAEFIELCRVTVARRAGKATVAKIGDAQEIRVGPGLAALAIRRTGDFLWVGQHAQDLQNAPSPKSDAGLIRWAKVDLGAVRAEAGRWAKAEGPARPEQVRPLSDRVLGLLGWMPATTSIWVERRKTSAGWEEKIVFGTKAQGEQ